MDDAYSIGISIALDDAVSAGIKTLSEDLLMLDRAIAATSSRIQMATAAALVLAQVVPAPQLHMPESVVQTIPAPPARDAEAPIPTWVAPILQSEPVLPTSPVAVQTVLPVTTSPAAAPSLPVPSSQPLTAAAPSVMAIAPPPPPPPIILPPPPVAPARLPEPQNMAPQPVAPVALPSLVGHTAAAMPHAHVDAAQVAPPAVLHVTLPATPAVSPQQAAAPVRAPEPVAPTTQPPPSNAPVEPPQQPISGVLEIDGAALGRWLSEHLAREVTRPPSGMTGFDTRLGPIWPGGQQGI